MKQHDKMKVALRYWLLGASHCDSNYFICVDALEFASSFHTGKRKDGVTPEFAHQVTIANYLRTLVPSIDHPAETIAVALLHDVAEDYDVGFDELEMKFGNRVATSVELLTKTHRGTKKSVESYFDGISKDPMASIVKGADRIHNLQSMSGVFTAEKKKAYVEEATEFIIPSLKAARRLFPSQEAAYENIKLVLNSQIELIALTL
jgi:(p)ppGpp synthase/HD superfamily hydrolase